MANQNGPGAHNAAAYSGMNGSIMPSAGHFSDMQTLMQNMESLSGWLEQNRQDWSQVQEGLARIEQLQQSRLGAETQLPVLNGNVPSEDAEKKPVDTAQLQNALDEAKQRIATLERAYGEQGRVLHQYEESLMGTAHRLREYVYEQQTHVTNVQQVFMQQLAQSRGETIEAQLTHQAWQAGLQRVSESVRAALAARHNEGLPWKRRIAALKEENRVLRAKVGWEPPVDSDDEGDELDPRAKGHAAEGSYDAGRPGMLPHPGQSRGLVTEVSPQLTL